MGFSSVWQKVTAGGVALLAAVVGWFLGTDSTNRVLLALVLGVVGFSLVLYYTRLNNVKRYKLLMARLYTDLDPEAFLAEVKRVDLDRMKPTERSTTEIHIANGLLAAGRPQEALEVLKTVESQAEPGAWEVLFTVAANRATCYLDSGQAKKAQRSMQHASDIVRQGKASAGGNGRPASSRPAKAGRPVNDPQDFWLKARKTLAFLQLRLDVARGRKINTVVLREDLERNKAPLQGIRVAALLMAAYEQQGDSAGAQEMRSYIVEHGGQMAVRRELLAAEE
ncbi:hypothetical protein VR010_14470 [Actinomycetaceae bacterium L2_0104]